MKTARSNSFSSSLSTKGSTSTAESDKSSLKSSSGRKAQCDLCKLSYSTEKELMEHMLSLMHHTKMEDREENPVHICTMCVVSCPTMAEYRKHIATESHQQKLSSLKFVGDNRDKERDKRGGNNLQRPEHFGTPGQDGEFHEKRFSQPYDRNYIPRGPQFNRYDQNGAPYQAFHHGSYGYENSVYHWERDRASNNIHLGNRGREAVEQNSRNQRDQHSVPWQSEAYNFNARKSNVEGGRYTPGSYDRRQFVFNREPYNGQQQSQGHQGPNSMDFTSDNFHCDWDEQSLCQQEQFLASMDEPSPSNAVYTYQRPHSVPLHKDFHERRANSRWDDPVMRDRKRPRHEDDVQESLAKSSRSVDLPSDDNIPVRDVPPRQRGSYVDAPMDPLQESASKSNRTQDLSARKSSLDNASDNILERAERLCKELRERREASQVQRNVMMKKQERELLNQKMSALIHKQQSYLKGHIKDQEDNDSGISSASTQPSRSNDSPKVPLPRRSSVGSSVSSIKPKTKERTLDEIRKSIEKSVLDNQDKSEQSLGKPRTPVAPRTKQRTLSGGDAGIVRPGEALTSAAAKPLSRFAPKPQLTKDSLKKMVNAPRSRDERLQLAKLLQSREDRTVPSSATRTSVQLEGMYDTSEAGDVNLELGSDTSAQTIKLEDLSEGVRNQILDLIGGDLSSIHVSQSQSDIFGHVSSRLGRKEKRDDNLENVIVLSDDEKHKNKNRKHAQQSAKDLFMSRPGKNDEDVSKAKKKKKKIQPDLAAQNAVKGKSQDGIPRNTAVTARSHINLKGNLRPTTPVHNGDNFKNNKTATVSDMDSDVEVISCSSDMEIDRNKSTDKNQKEKDKEPFSVSTSSTLYKPIPSHILNYAKNRASSIVQERPAAPSPVEPSVDTNKASLNSVNIREKFPTLMSGLRSDPPTNSSISPMPRETPASVESSVSATVSSTIHTSHSSPGQSTSRSNSPHSVQDSYIKNKISESTSVQKNTLRSTSPNLTERYTLLQQTSQALSGQTTMELSGRSSLHTALRSHSPQTFQTAQGSSLSSLSYVPSAQTETRSTSYVPVRPMSPQASLTSQASLPVETQTSLQQTLPSSTWPTKDTSPAESSDHPLTQKSTRSTVVSMSSEPVLTSSPRNRDMATLLPAADENSSSGKNKRLVLDDNQNSSFSTIHDETTSHTMSELLILSEREEEVKQELMSMELRLTRLHRLLEQAVVQINKCTERRNQLHEEEQDLAKQRLALLRDVAATKHSWRSDASEPNMSISSDLTSSERLHDSRTATGQSKSHSETPTTATLSSAVSLHGSSNVATSTVTSQSRSALSDRVEELPGSSLSKADWLAKFSSYLPQDPITDRSKSTSAKSSCLPASSSSDQMHLAPTSSSFSHPLTSLNVPISITSNLLIPEKDKTSPSVVEDVHMESQEVTANVTARSNFANDYRSTTMSDASGLPSYSMNSESHTKDRPTPSSIATSSSAASGFFKSPIMYVGSFRSAATPMNLSPPVIVLDKASVVSSLNHAMHTAHSDTPTQHQYGRSDSIASSAGGESRDAGTNEAAFADLMSLANHRKHSTASGYGHAGSDSDIGSIASSVASGSSLGEQITRYCRSTPGASMDSREPFRNYTHELSVIMSDTSERRGFDSQIEEEDDKKKRGYIRSEDWQSVIRPCSVPLERLEMSSNTGIYGSLNKEALKSAEALHLMERNYEGPACPSSITSDGGKKKKRRTRQERETSGLTRRRRRWVLSTSSEEESSKAKGDGKPELDIDLTAVTSREKRDGIPSSKDDDSSEGGPHSMEKEKARSTPHNLDRPELLSPSRISSTDVTIAECDSSTNFGMVDSESIAMRTNTLKEMRDSFERTFGRSPRTSPRHDSFPDINSTTSDAMTSKGIVLTDGPEVQSSSLNLLHGNFKPASHTTGSLLELDRNGKEDVIEIKSEADDCDDVIILGADSARKKMSSHSVTPPSTSKNGFDDTAGPHKMACKFKGDYGPVVDIDVVRGRLYVGYSNSGVHVYDVEAPAEANLISAHSFPYLQCLAVTELSDGVTMVIGNGGKLVFCRSIESEQNCFSLDATIKCLLVSSPLVYAGLDTGEICVFDTKKMEQRDRFICADHPVHCLVEAQEGATKLLCASIQDGTIIVLSAQQCLPLRILTGHTKTAFSLQVHGPYLYSGSGDSTVLVHNLHTATVEHSYNDNKGLVKSVCYSDGYLYTGGMDKLVRGYNTKTHKLQEVYYGAERGVITKILVHDKKLYTGNISGSVDVTDIHHRAKNSCRLHGCQLNFVNETHLYWHCLEDHNMQMSEMS